MPRGNLTFISSHFVFLLQHHLTNRMDILIHTLLQIPPLPPFGSCKYEAQDLFDLLEAMPNFDCDEYFPGNGCQFPVLPGHYGGPDITLKLPAILPIPDALKPLIGGTVEVELKWRDSGDGDMACIKYAIEIDVV